jgi:hypothetical protein
MPGLLRGVARTAVVAGTASAVNGRVQRRQAARFAEKDAQIAAQQDAAYQEQVYAQAPPPPPPAPAAPVTDVVAQLKGLGELRDQGVLTEDEFAAQKAKILAG